MTQAEALTERIVREALDEAGWRGMEREVAVRLHELCRDTIAAARMARVRFSIVDPWPSVCECADGECQGH